MKKAKFFNTFRVRLLLILVILLIATLVSQYFLNLETERDNAKRRETQEKSLVAGLTIGINSISSSEYLQNLLKREGGFLSEGDLSRIADILVIDNRWRISDALQDDYRPYTNDAGEAKYTSLSELTDLPPIANLQSIGKDIDHFPNAKPSLGENHEEDGEAHVIPIDTDQGRRYVMVVMRSYKGEGVSRAAKSSLYTLGVLLISTLITILFVWRFTRPIANLSEAARRVAEGDLKVRVPDDNRVDEMGQLASRFNEMTAQLEKTRELEAKLQETQKSAVVGRLASAIAHEIRNPLNYINLTLDHLRAKFVPEDEEKKKQFESLTAQLKTEVGRINEQITDFLRYSRPLKLDLKPTNIRETIEDSMRIVEGQAQEQNIVTSIIEHENTQKVIGDSETLRSVFNNLFLNAVQAMKNGGKLSVDLATVGNVVKLEVADTGEGISPENLTKIFEPYFSTKETGTGLGLAIVKRIVDEHKGTIDVESDLNIGTKFTIKLPHA